MGQANIPACPIFFMPRRLHAAIVVPIALALLPVATFSQASPKSTPSETSLATNRGIDLAEKGHCKEALPILKKSTPVTRDKQAKLKMGLATIRCALSLDQVETAVNALLWLNREFPNDPDVLYITTHAYSDLSARASLQLARTAASSYQAHELNAESLEMQGKWDDAAAEYRVVLEHEAQLPGIHFRIGRLILSKPETPTTAADARKEFEEELKIDPNNAGAEYVLGELSSQAQQWDEAIQHFSRAAKLDAGFSEAALGLGSSYVSAGKFVEAIPPLESYVKLQPGNPAGHYQLAIAYSRAGRKDDAKREAALQKETTEKLEQEKQRAANALQKQFSGQGTQKPEPQN
jgi:tetratricopeptide (TPR) repeat protein